MTNHNHNLDLRNSNLSDDPDEHEHEHERPAPSRSVWRFGPSSPSEWRADTLWAILIGVGVAGVMWAMVLVLNHVLAGGRIWPW